MLWLVATAAIVVATGWLVWDIRANELARAEREIDNLSQVLAEQTARAVHGTKSILRETEQRLTAGAASGSMMDEQSIHTLLRARVSGAPQLRSLSVSDAEGRLRRTSARFPTPAIGVADRSYFTVQRDRSEAGGAYLDHPEQDRLDGGWSLPISLRLPTPAGGFAGVIVAAIDPAYFERVYASIHLDEGSAVALFMRDGTLIAGHPHREEAIGKAAGDSPVFRALDADAATLPRPAHGSLLRTSGAAPEIVAYREIAGFPLVVAVSEREEVALASWRRQATMLIGGAGGVIFLLALAALALSRKLAQEEALSAALHDSQSRLQGIIGSAMDAIITVDETGHIVLFNPSAEKMFRCTQAEALGASLERFIPERHRAAHAGHMREFGATGISSRSMGGRLDIAARRADGEEFPADISISQLEAGGHKLYTAMLRDVTLRKAAEDELRESHQQLRELSASLQSVREEERTRLARELHDELGQHLTGLKMDLSWLESRLRDGQPALLTKTDGMKRLIDATVLSMRRIAAELRPSILDDLGLAAALEWLAQEFSQRSGVEVKLDLDDGGCSDGTVDEARATALFRIVQESLTNVARHAGASQVRISLKQADGQLLLEVQDNGRGMPAAAQYAGRFGLLGIRERAYLFGGLLRIASQPGAGTTITVTLPLPAAENTEQPA